MRPLRISIPFLLLLPAPAVFAGDIPVLPGGSIQSAIDAAVDGDRVLVSPGTYVETIDFMGKAIEVLGTGGADQTVLDGNSAGPVVRFSGGEGPNSRLRGVTVTGGYASYGAGGIVCASGAAPLVEDCLVWGNRGKFGGGISGSPTMRRCSIFDNTASLTHGGGVYGAPHMTLCAVASNTATSATGGGLYLVGGDAVLDRCVIIENSAVFANSRGGGIYVDSSATVTMTGCVVAGNFSTGGAFAGYGGGMRVESAGSTAIGCAIVDNSVSGSSIFGGGVYGPLVLQGSIVRDNVGGQLDGGATATYCDVSGGYAGIGNVDLDPLFVDAANRDYHLRPDSPLIDLGDPGMLDPDGTVQDIGAFPFQSLYTRANTVAASWSLPGWPEISVGFGGYQTLRTIAGSGYDGGLFLLLGSFAGTSPGFPALGVTVPLNPDFYLIATISAPNSPPLDNSLGILDLDGAAQTTFTLPSGAPAALAGMTAHHAVLALASGSSAVTFVSNTEGVAILP